jgi:putative methyltransferase
LKTKNIGPGDASSLIRCLPGEDATNGFFVSCFVRDLGPVTRKRKEMAGNDIVEADSPKLRHKKKKKRAKVKDI